MPDVDVRVSLASEPGCGDCSAEALHITAVNHHGAPVTLWATVLITTFGARVYLQPHLDYPVTLWAGEWCVEWAGCRALAERLHGIGCTGRTDLVPMVLQRDPAEHMGQVTNDLVRAAFRTGSHVDRRGIEHRGDSFVFDVDRRRATP